MNTEINHQVGETLDSSALNVLKVVSQGSKLSQREVAQKVGISVGLVNLTVKRLVQTGYIKVTNFSSRRAEYWLTSKGVSEISARSYQYLVKTVRTYQEFCRQAQKLIANLREKGHYQFIVVGEGEIADLILFTLKEMGDPNITWRREREVPITSSENGGILLDCRDGQWGTTPGISVLSELLN